jgi:hypothetical protein
LLLTPKFKAKGMNIMQMIYVLREGQGNVFKIGRTSGDIQDRLKGLRTGNSQGLFVFEVVETDNASVCEKFFHNLLATRRVERPGGGKEFYKMDSDDHMRQVIEKFKGMEIQIQGARQVDEEFGKVQCSQELREPVASDMELLSQLRTIDTRLLEIKEETEYLNFVRAVIESQLKQRIGGSLGIRGVATWETKIRRNFSEDLLRERDPELYQELLERFYRLDTSAWRQQQPAHYKQIQTTYFVPSVSRKFEILGS